MRCYRKLLNHSKEIENVIVHNNMYLNLSRDCMGNFTSIFILRLKLALQNKDNHRTKLIQDIDTLSISYFSITDLSTN